MDENKIHVYCRLKPLSDAYQEPMFSASEDRRTVYESSTAFNDDPQRAYDVSRVFEEDISQEEVYQYACKPLVDTVLAGHNAAILCYGQTGSGKTHTMFAPSTRDVLNKDLLQHQDLQGVVPRACRKLFEGIKADSSLMQYTVQLSTFELYNEKLFDLFSPSRKAITHPDALLKLKPSLNLRQTQSEIFVDGATAQEVGSYEEAMQLVTEACSVRATASTQSNEYSSRSHMLVLFTVNKYCPRSFKTFHAQFYLCDLAGSERQSRTQVDGDRLKEACNINRSLLALGKVIHVLSYSAEAQQSMHVPYRDSKLTRLLQNAFGGNGKTALICTVSNEEEDFRESLSTLQFGNRASCITNTLSRTVTAQSVPELKRLLRAAKVEISNWRAQVDKLQHEVLQAQFKQPSIGSGLTMDSFLCPITSQVMLDPVIAQDGYTYERAAIEWHFKLHGVAKSPVTGLVLSSPALLANRTLAKATATFSTSRNKQWNCSEGYASLPDELLHKIFFRLDGVTLARLCQVCQSFNQYIHSNTELWQHACHQTLPPAQFLISLQRLNLNVAWRELPAGQRSWREVFKTYLIESRGSRRRLEPGLNLHQLGGVSLLAKS
eukprot:m.46121 g.46121  ORF g.46121 m.46121 type:complete len:605 (+) comp13118_c0_seq2:30-1844(+)